MTDKANDRAIKESVRKAYARRAQERTCGCAPAASSCCSPKAQSVGERETKAAAIYSPAELALLAGGVVDLSFGCGNPTAIAALRPGETVLDLGCGGGIDVFLAASKVGPKGRAIGLDMTPEMLALARDNARKMRAANVEFRQGEMEAMPVEDGSIDVVISNCVINLSPDKDAVFREVYRVLKPGGRMAVSDIVLCSEPPAGVREDPQLWGSCVAGALLQDEYLDKIRRAGFRDVRVESRVWESAAAFSGRGWPEEVRRYLQDQVLSARVTASKP